MRPSTGRPYCRTADADASTTAAAPSLMGEALPAAAGEHKAEAAQAQLASYKSACCKAAPAANGSALAALPTCDGAFLWPEEGLQLPELLSVHLGHGLVLQPAAAAAAAMAPASSADAAAAGAAATAAPPTSKSRPSHHGPRCLAASLTSLTTATAPPFPPATSTGTNCS